MTPYLNPGNVLGHGPMGVVEGTGPEVTAVSKGEGVVHLACAIQSSHDLAALRRTNAVGSERVFRAVVESDVPERSSTTSRSNGRRCASSSWLDAIRDVLSGIAGAKGDPTPPLGTARG